jgi:beta-glucosidase
VRTIARRLGNRCTLALPGRQDELVTRVAAVSRPTIVVINSGMPVLMPWAADVAAVIYAWLPGQAFGLALADVLLGTAEPGGRLPVTMPASEADCPVLRATPDENGLLRYDEGLLIGYRGYDANGAPPRYPFGPASASPPGRTSRWTAQPEWRRATTSSSPSQ